MIKKIKQKNFKKLNVLVLQTKKILNTSKTIIFINKIKDRLRYYNIFDYYYPSQYTKKETKLFKYFYSIEKVLNKSFL